VEPFGEERSDYRVAHALAVIVNMFRGKDDQPVSVADLLPRVGILADRAKNDDTPKPHPNVQRFEAMMALWEQSQT
jgi:hypothetical protein